MARTKAKKYGTITIEDPVYTRTLSKVFNLKKPLPFEFNPDTAKALEDLQAVAESDEEVSIRVRSYQERMFKEVWEYPEIEVVVDRTYFNWDMDDIHRVEKKRFDLAKRIRQTYNLFWTNANHACKRMLSEAQDWGKYTNYPNHIMPTITFTFKK